MYVLVSVFVYVCIMRAYVFACPLLTPTSITITKNPINPMKPREEGGGDNTPHNYKLSSTSKFQRGEPQTIKGSRWKKEEEKNNLEEA